MTAARGREDLENAGLETVDQKLVTSPQGLSAGEIAARLEKYGQNELVDREASE